MLLQPSDFVKMMVQRAVLGLATFLAFLGKLRFLYLQQKLKQKQQNLQVDNDEYCRSWRLAVEANTAEPWRTVPHWCYSHVETYIMGGEYQHDLALIKDQILEYAKEIKVGDGMDAWVLDVDDTCISNVCYYKANGFGCEPFDSRKFKEWIMKGECEAIPAMLVVFKELVERGFKVFLVTGRDQATLSHVTTLNLHHQGFIGYHHLFLRSEEYRGERAARYKSEIRKKIEGEGYKIWGNVGDQWSDLQGYSLGNRTFKLPNPMYFIP